MINLDILAVTEGVTRLNVLHTCTPQGQGTSIGAPTIAGVVALMLTVNPCLKTIRS